MSAKPNYSDRKGDFIVVYSGKRFYPADPRAEDIFIEDIARGLSNVCRYTGHVQEFYSVAQHSVLCARQAPPEHKLATLLHDGSEAFIADIARPVKPMLPDYRAIEHNIERVIAEKYRLTFPMHPIIKEIDTRMLITEARQLLGPHVEPWWLNYDIEPFEMVITPWSPKEARLAFLTMFDELWAMQQGAD